ncbi:DUF1707 SHOCT-like domain-containing protein [Nocardia paucivorans]|uniref:DUF1707 SHOCT-like domain-containing protein n=1 Tax=Nocardia paucivorans TaxID=114259 RepID=UPI0002D285C5|nr:DUF1707 domain-containing protein [Nocardia paucivorans]
MARGELRARDSDRVEICGLLDGALADGQLTPDEHAERTTTAMRAPTLAALRELVADLQVAAEPVFASARPERSGRRWWAALAVITAAAVLGATVGALHTPTAELARAAPVAERSPSPKGPSPVTGPGLTALVDAYRQAFGDTVVDTISAHPDFALVQRIDLVTEQPILYRYADEKFERVSGSVVSWAAGRPIDLGTIDVSVLARLLAGAPESTRVPDGTVDHIGIGYELAVPLEEGPVVEIFVKNSAGSTGHMVVSPAGKPLAIFPAR